MKTTAFLIITLLFIGTAYGESQDRGPACARLESAPTEISEAPQHTKDEIRNISSEGETHVAPTAMEQALVSHNGSPESVDCEIESKENN